MKTYKGFNKNLQCRGMQYEVGKDYEEERAEVCETGLHSCENPLDVFNYYAPCDSRYCECEADGDIDKSSDDSKVASTKLHVEAEIGITGLVKAGVKFIFDRVNWDNDKKSNGENYSAATNTGYQSAATNTGDQSAATNTGYRSAATNTGDRSAATNTGYQSAAIVKGKESIAISTGYEGKAKGSLGCWIGLAEWQEDDEGEYHIVDFKSAKVDGGKIKEDVFYTLENGEFKEVEK